MPAQPAAFLRNFVYLALLLAVFKVYRIEERAFQGRAFQMLVTLALAALPVHYLAPFRWKKPCFRGGLGGAACSGSSASRSRRSCLPRARSSWASASCRSPGPPARSPSARWPLALACARTGLPRTIIPDNVLPILASMFMFRMIIYLYELKHARSRETLVDTLSYFFLLPNFCFMHFPVVDYRTMQRGYFADDVHALQRRGLQMMLRGTVHLLLYRLVYHEMLIPPSKVHNLASLACYLVCNYLLYLQVSGQFHIACGMLHLYGFQLPRDASQLPAGDGVHRLLAADQHLLERLHGPALLQSGRVPAQAVAPAGGAGGGYGGGLPGDLAVACLPVVLAARKLGLLGSGRPLLGNLGRAGAGECAARRPPEPDRGAGRRRLCEPADPPRADASARVKVAATFTTIAVLWSLWSSPSLSAWLEMLGRGFQGS